jgi:hypothetical protein
MLASVPVGAALRAYSTGGATAEGASLEQTPTIVLAALPAAAARF